MNKHFRFVSYFFIRRIEKIFSTNINRKGTREKIKNYESHWEGKLGKVVKICRFLFEIVMLIPLAYRFSDFIIGFPSIYLSIG